jgi:hypothetical protein
VNDEGEPAEVEPVDEALDRPVVRVVRVVLAPERLVRAPEAEEVGHHDTPDVHERRDQLAVEKPPRRLAVEEKEGIARALVDEVHPQTVLNRVAGLVRPTRKAGEALVGRPVRVHAPTVRRPSAEHRDAERRLGW